MKLFHSLKHRRFAFLWTGQSVSRLGDHLYQIAIAWWVLKRTGSAMAMGGIMIFAFAPMLVFLLIGGAAVDRLRRVPVMLASDLLRGALVLAVAVMAFTARLEVWQLYAASLLFGFVDSFFNPAYAAAVPDMVPANDLSSANSLTSLSQQFGRVLGPALGAAIVGTVGVGWAFAINGISFLVSAACLLPLLRDDAKPQACDLSEESSARDVSAESTMQTREIVSAELPQIAARPASICHDIREGIGFVTKSPWLWMTILMFTLVNVLLAGPYSVALPFLVSGSLSRGVGTLGLLYAMFPLGYALAAITFDGTRFPMRRGWSIYLGAALAGLMIGSMAFRLPISVLAAAAFVNGFGLELAGLAWTNVLQQRVPGHMLGRVSSIDSIGSFALLPIGYALAGWATDHVGASHVLLGGGGLAFLIAIAGLLNPAVRTLK